MRLENSRLKQPERGAGTTRRDTPDEQLGKALVRAGHLSQQDLVIAQRLAEMSGDSIGRVLLAEGFVSQKQLQAALIEVTGLPSATPQALRSALARLSVSAVQDVLLTGYLPVTLNNGTVFYATADPGPWDGAAMGMPVACLTTANDLRAACLDVWGSAVLYMARNDLAETRPHLSAHRRLTRAQTLFAIGLMVVVGGFTWLVPEPAALLLGILLSLIFLFVIVLKGWALLLDRPSSHAAPQIRLRDRDLPVYSVLVPIFKEVEVLPDLVDALLALDYPASKLDIKVILEQEDIETRCAVAAMKLPGCFETIVVPKLMPQTKPKALNYALRFVRGTYLVIYDAEDQPEPDQLRQAVARFAAGPDDVVCLQGRLSYFNHRENWLTRQFTIEYAMLFDLLLPVMARFNLPLPLGGTSNHFRVDRLREVGAWDPFNVTEDADLGMRFARAGYRVDVIPSTTFEEANCHLGNWLRQRSRWIKGWIQTWFVHMRAPRTLLQELGWRGYLSFQAVTAGIILSGLLHPFCLGFLIWALATSDYAQLSLTPADWLLAFLGTVVFISGMLVAFGSGLAALKHRPELRYLRLTLLTMPAYWLLMSLGAWYAVWEFIRRPFHWQKTRHGISQHGLNACSARPKSD